MGKVAVTIEDSIYQEAINFIPKAEVKKSETEGPSWLTIGLTTLGMLGAIGLTCVLYNKYK
ncbi:hypothetical protein [Simkania sp.]|uniref:hypothetical protein n=1 Tax=Simkania sp. TaxID=34094 RepID=UPI003B52ECBB